MNDGTTGSGVFLWPCSFNFSDWRIVRQPGGRALRLRCVVALGVGLFCIHLGVASAQPTEKESPHTFTTTHLNSAVDYAAPDGMAVRLLPELPRGGIAHFELEPFGIARAVSHRTVDEIWYFLTGRGQMWRKQGDREQTVDVFPGVVVTIPQGTQFQVRSCGWELLAALGVTMPPWPGGDAEIIFVTGPWKPTVGRSVHPRLSSARQDQRENGAPKSNTIHHDLVDKG